MWLKFAYVSAVVEPLLSVATVVFWVLCLLLRERQGLLIACMRPENVEVIITLLAFCDRFEHSQLKLK